MTSGNDPSKSKARRGHRFPVENVQGKLHFNTEARVLNVSLTGVALESGLPVRVGRSYSISLRHDDEQMIVLSGRVAWCHLKGTRKGAAGEATPVYAAGLAFDDTLTEKASQLVRFLERAAIITVGQRVTGRFKVAGAQLISLATSHEFEVKNLSARGMLIETDLSPEAGAVFDIEVALPAYTLQTRAKVAGVRETRLADKRVFAEVEMEFVGLDDAERNRLSGFIASELQPPESPAT
jgi:hypothetical protein